MPQINQPEKRSFADLVETVANAGHAKILAPSPAAQRISELEDAVVMLRNALRNVQKNSMGSGVCCCGSDMDDHGLMSDHSPVDEADHFIDMTLRQTDDLVKEH